MARRGLSDESRLFLRLCLRLDYVVDVEPILRHVRHLNDQHEGNGPIEPADLLFYLRSASTSKQHFVDELCRLLYVMGRDDLVAKLVAPFDGGILSVPEACRRLQHFRSADESLLERLADLVPRMMVKIMTRSSGLSREKQREVMRDPVAGTRLMLTLLRVHQPGFMHCLWDWFVELDLAGPMKVMEEYIIPSKAWPHDPSLALVQKLPMNLNMPPAKRVYQPGMELNDSAASAPPLSSLGKPDFSPLAHTHMIGSPRSTTSSSAGPPVTSQTVSTTSSPSSSTLELQGHEHSSPLPNRSSIQPPSSSSRGPSPSTPTLVSCSSGSETEANLHAAKSGDVPPSARQNTSPPQPTQTPISRVVLPSVLGGSKGSTAMRILSKLSQTRPPAGQLSTANTSAASLSTTFRSVLNPKLSSTSGTATATRTSGTLPQTKSSGSSSSISLPSTSEAQPSLQTRQGYDRFSNGDVVPLLAPMTSSTGTSASLQPPSRTDTSGTMISSTTFLKQKPSLHPGASSMQLTLQPPAVASGTRQLRSSSHGQISPFSPPARHSPRLVKLEPAAKRAPAALGDQLNVPGQAVRLDSGKPSATPSTSTSTLDALFRPLEQDMAGVVDQTAVVRGANQLYPDLEESLRNSRQLAPCLADDRTFSNDPPGESSSDSSDEHESSESESDMYYSARDSPGAMTDGGLQKSKPKRSKMKPIRKNPKRSARQQK